MPNDDDCNQAKGLGNMLSFWERMRNVCPKVNSYNGPILNSENQQCVTSRDLDEAMLETRQFWFDSPDQFDDAWQPVLEVYASAPRWLVDGTNAAHLMHHTAHLLHPSQTVMSYFKEPQRAVAEI